MLFRLFYGYRMEDGSFYILNCYTLISIESTSDSGIRCVCEDKDSPHYGKRMLVSIDRVGRLERVG